MDARETAGCWFDAREYVCIKYIKLVCYRRFKLKFRDFAVFQFSLVIKLYFSRENKDAQPSVSNSCESPCAFRYRYCVDRFSADSGPK